MYKGYVHLCLLGGPTGALPHRAQQCGGALGVLFGLARGGATGGGRAGAGARGPQDSYYDIL